VDTGVPSVYKRTWAVDGGSVILTTDATAPQSYDAATGARGVSFSTQEPYLMALSAAGGILYALDALGIFYAFHTDSGTEIWRKQVLSSDDPPGTGLTIDGGSIYVGTVSGTLYKVASASGQVQWTYHPGSGMESDVAAAGGLVYLKDNNGTLHAINAATSKQVWTRTSTATVVYGLTVAGGRVYYTTALALQALDAKSGAPVWAFTAPNNAELLSTPAVDGGLVFIGCYDDGLYAVQA
jgi:outer membrane protein assembly factor BamB